MWFWIDLLATFPLDVFITGGSAARLGRLGKLAKLMRLFKLLRLLKLGRIMKRFKKANTLHPAALLLINTVGGLLFVLHYAACGYWAIISNQAEKDNALWYPPPKTFEDPKAAFSRKYSFAFFFAVSALVGNGWDVMPNTGMYMMHCAIIQHMKIMQCF